MNTMAVEYEDDESVTTAVAARILGVSVSTLQKWRRQRRDGKVVPYGPTPSYRGKTTVVYKVGDLRKWCDKQNKEIAERYSG